MADILDLDVLQDEAMTIDDADSKSRLPFPLVFSLLVLRVSIRRVSICPDSPVLASSFTIQKRFLGCRNFKSKELRLGFLRIRIRDSDFTRYARS